MSKIQVEQDSNIKLALLTIAILLSLIYSELQKINQKIPQNIPQQEEESDIKPDNDILDISI